MAASLGNDSQVACKGLSGEFGINPFLCDVVFFFFLTETWSMFDFP